MSAPADTLFFFLLVLVLLLVSGYTFTENDLILSRLSTIIDSSIIDSYHHRQQPPSDSFSILFFDVCDCLSTQIGRKFDLSFEWQPMRTLLSATTLFWQTTHMISQG